MINTFWFERYARRMALGFAGLYLVTKAINEVKDDRARARLFESFERTGP